MFYHGPRRFRYVQHRLWIVRNFSPKATAVSARKYNAAVREIKEDAPAAR